MDNTGNVVSETEMLSMTCNSNSNYTVVGISGNDTATASVQVLVDQMNLTISGSQEICKGDKVWLQANGGLTYEWSTGQNSASIMVSPTETTTYSVTSTTANGCEFTTEHTVVVLDTYKAKIVMKTDWYPYETSWKLKDSSGNVVATNNQTYNQSNKKYKQWVKCLPDECYTLEVYDSYGDGMCCSYGYGYFKVVSENGTVLANGGQFGSQTSAPFCFTGEEAAALPFNENEMEVLPFQAKTDGEIVQKDNMEDVQVYPNPAYNELTIDAMSSTSMITKYEIMDVTGRVLESYSYDKAIKKSTLNISSYLAGNYIIKIYNHKTVKLIKFIKN